MELKIFEKWPEHVKNLLQQEIHVFFSQKPLSQLRSQNFGKYFVKNVNYNFRKIKILEKYLYYKNFKICTKCANSLARTKYALTTFEDAFL